jgi:hypothetical protein
MDNVIVEFTPTPDDYKKTSALFLLRKSWIWILSGWFGVSLILLVIVSWVTLDIAAINFKGSVIAIIIGYISTMYPYSIPAGSMRQAIKDKKLCLPITYSFDETQIVASTSEYEIKYKWTNYINVYETKLYYLLVQEGGNSIQFIPKRAFEKPADEKKFRDLAVKQLGNMQSLESGIKGWRLAFISGVVSFVVNYSVLAGVSK